MRTLIHRSRILEKFREMADAAKDKNWDGYVLGLVSVLHFVCNLTQEAGLESVLSAACSSKQIAQLCLGSRPSLDIYILMGSLH